MDVNGYPFQGSSNVRKPRYIGSLISHCKNINSPIICYTHTKNLQELDDIKSKYKLNNLEIIKVSPVGNFYFMKKFFPSLLCNEISICIKKIK